MFHLGDCDAIFQNVEGKTNRGFIAWTQQNITQLLHLEKSETVLYNNFWDFFWNVDFVLSASLAAQAADQLLLPLNQNRANHLHPNGAHPVSDIKVSQLIKVHTKGYLQGSTCFPAERVHDLWTSSFTSCLFWKVSSSFPTSSHVLHLCNYLQVFYVCLIVSPHPCVFWKENRCVSSFLLCQAILSGIITAFFSSWSK